MTNFSELIQYLNPEIIVQQGGLWLIILIIFLESGLFLFFLPGDSLLFLSGLFCSAGWLKTNPIVLVFAMMAAGAIGYMLSYWIGRRFSHRILSGNDVGIIKARHIEKTRDYYIQNQKVGLIFGRFLPIVRTFIPLLSGAFRVDFKQFMVPNLIGAIIWPGSLVFAGYFLGGVTWVREHLEVIMVVVALLPFTPFLKKFIKRKKAGEKMLADEQVKL